MSGYVMGLSGGKALPLFGEARRLSQPGPAALAQKQIAKAWAAP
ncbi:hypothetical protein N8942_00250 [Planktomarina temperata]|nr:hypothetical protein [Planktomarina temperata]